MEPAAVDVLGMPNTWGLCRLLLDMRNVMDLERSRLVPLRDISRHLTEAGHPLSKDAVFRHFELHVAPLAEAELFIGCSDDHAVARAAG